MGEFREGGKEEGEGGKRGGRERREKGEGEGQEEGGGGEGGRWKDSTNAKPQQV